MKKRWKSIVMCAFACCMMLLLGNGLKAEAATVTKGKYTYFASRGTIYRMHNSTGKTKKIKKMKFSEEISIKGIKGDYLYFEADEFYPIRGTTTSWPYIYRVKTNGTHVKRLAQGRSPQVYGNYIYYAAVKFKRREAPYHEGKVLGVYRMKLDGSKKKKLCGGYINCVKVYQKKIYLNKFYLDNSTPGKTNGIYSMSLTGKNIRRIAEGIYDKEFFISNGKLYLHDDTSSPGVLFEVNLKNGNAYYKGEFEPVGVYGDELYITRKTSDWMHKDLYSYNTRTGKRKLIRKMNLPREVIGGKKWILVCENYSGSGGRYTQRLVKMLKNGRSMSIVDKYFRS